MKDSNHSLRIKAKGFEATAQGWGGLLTLVLLVALIASGLAMGWWHVPG